MKLHGMGSRMLMLLLVAGLMLVSSSCRKDDGTKGTLPAQTTETGETMRPIEVPTIPSDVEVQAGDYRGTDPLEAAVLFDGTHILVEGKGATVCDNVLQITAAGTYRLQGVLSNGQIVVDTADSEKVELILDGVGVSCAKGPAILVKNAPKRVVLVTSPNSVNRLEDGADYLVPDDEQVEGELYPNACVYATADLRFDGEGELYIVSQCGKGVNSKDDVEIVGGKLYVSAPDDGVRGNDSVTVSGGYVSIEAGADGIQSANTDVEGKGFVTVSGGEIYLSCGTDGIQSAKELTVSGGLVSVSSRAHKNTLQGEDNVTLLSFSWGGPGWPGGQGGGHGGPGGGFGGEGNSSKPAYSCKGLKAGTVLTVTAGTVSVQTLDDALHAEDTVCITGGQLYVESGDDGVHGNNNVTVDGGTIEIASSYEGIEAVTITVNGGEIHVKSSDDGFNACGGTSLMGGGRKPFSSSSTPSSDQTTPLLAFHGGYVVVDASGDGIDSNGNIEITNGTVIVYGPTNNGNGAIDEGDGGYSCTVSGGVLLAVGSSGMASTAVNNGQAVLAFRCGTLSEGTLLSVLDAKENVVFAFETPKTIQSVVLSTPALVSGDTYTILTGGSLDTAAVDGVYTPGQLTGGETLGSLTAQ